MDGVRNFIIRGVNVRRNTDAGAGAKVDQNLAAAKFSGYFAAVRDIKDYCATPCCRVARTADSKACLVRQADKALGLPLRLGADRSRADFVDDLVAGPGRVHRWDIGRAVKKTADVRRIFDGPADELERACVSSPAHSGWPKLRIEIGADIKIASAGPAEQPLDGTTGGEVEVERNYIERDDPGGFGRGPRQGSRRVRAPERRWRQGPVNVNRSCETRRARC